MPRINCPVAGHDCRNGDREQAGVTTHPVTPSTTKSSIIPISLRPHTRVRFLGTFDARHRTLHGKRQTALETEVVKNPPTSAPTAGLLPTVPLARFCSGWARTNNFTRRSQSLQDRRCGSRTIVVDGVRATVYVKRSRPGSRQRLDADGLEARRSHRQR